MKSKFLVLLFVAAAIPASAVSINTFGTAYTQNFDTLASSGTSSTLPLGWAFSEVGTITPGLYSAGTGSSTTGDTYSFGASANTERAFGTLRSGSLVSTIGAHFENLTGGTITSLLISYVGEQWRIGALGRSDRLDFQVSFDAASLTTGTWTDVNPLDFSSPNLAGPVGALFGNAFTNRTALSSSSPSLSIPDGAAFWLRWLDVDATGSDDGLAIDDFSLTAYGVMPPPASTPDTGTTAFLFSIPLLGLFALRRLTYRKV